MPDARIRLSKAKFAGEILLDGQRATFSAHVSGPRLDAEFQLHPQSDKPLDEWQLFRALEKFVDDNLRG